MADHNVPVMCTLATKQAAERSVEWQDLRGLAQFVTPIDGGSRFVLDPKHEVAVRDLAERERTCCAFLTITVDVADGALRLDVTAPTEEGRQVVALIAGESATP